MLGGEGGKHQRPGDLSTAALALFPPLLAGANMCDVSGARCMHCRNILCVVFQAQNARPAAAGDPEVQASVQSESPGCAARVLFPVLAVLPATDC